MHRLIRWTTPLITLGVAIFIIFLLIDVNQLEPDPNIGSSLSENNVSSESVQSGRRWLEQLANNERQGYFYPVNEIYVKLDLDQQLVNEKTYLLTATLRDPYQLFCLKQELREHKLRYTLKQEKQGAELLVSSKDETKIKAFLQALKNYEITATILPYKEDLQWKNIK